MRYGAGHKEETRERILDVAAEQFRRRGVAGAALPEIMKAAGLTVGGFYRHFDSKEDLFLAALERAMDRTVEMMRTGSSPLEGTAWMQRAAAIYLHPAHRENVAGGCPLPAITPEVARGSEPARERFQETLSEIVDEIEAKMAPDPALASRDQAWGFLATLVGGLLLARGVEDDRLAEEILKACRRVAGGEPTRA